MKITQAKLPLEGALLLEAFEADDARGRFSKFFESRLVEELGFKVCEVFASVNHRNVIRGLHFQKPHAQARFVWCLKGKIFDVLVDLRRNSKTFRKWHGEMLGGDKVRGIYVPKGFAHGFLSLEEGSHVLYLADEPWAPECEKGIIYNDPTLGINWPKVAGVAAGAKPIISPRDAAFSAFKDEFVY